jgi:hypothetical protein
LLKQIADTLKGGDKLYVIEALHVKAFWASGKTVNVGTFTSFGREVFQKIFGMELGRQLTPENFNRMKSLCQLESIL